MENQIEESDPNFMEYALKRSLLSRNKLAIILRGEDGKAQYCCVECPVRYSNKEQLEIHLCMHNKQYRYLCGMCGTGLKRKEHLDRHTLEHQEVRPFKCPDCGKAFKRKEHLNIHITIHKNDRTHECSICHRSFYRKDHLQKHLQVHSKLFTSQNLFPMNDLEFEVEVKQEVKEEVKEEVCDEDEKPYITDDSYEDYDMQDEIEAPDSFDSSECHSDSLNSSAMEPSIEIRTPDSGTNVRPYVCHICYKSYKRKDHLKIHSWTHMKKDKQCSGCGKSFHMDSQLVAHTQTCIQTHIQQRAQVEKTPDPVDNDDFDPEQMFLPDNPLLHVRRRNPAPEVRPHQCVICHRRFKRKQHLKVHANIHLKASIWCSLCNEGFLSNVQFEQHSCRTPAAAEAEDQQQQPEAKKENKLPNEILEHSAEVPSPEPASLAAADEQNIPTPVRVFVCRYCHKPFKRRDHYKIHLNIHTGVKSFFCPDCGKGFYRKDHLQKHSQTHRNKPKAKKALPELVPIGLLKKPEAEAKPQTKPEIRPEITIHAPSSSKLRVPLQIKVPYQMVLAGPGGARTLTVLPPPPALT